MSWTDERVETLSRLWLEGKSASQISAILGGGLTRNAVIGKVHRLGLAGRGKPPASGPTDEPHAAAVGAPAPRRMAPRSVQMSAAPAASAMPRMQGNTALALSQAQPETMRPAMAPEDVVIPLSLRVTIVELRETMCKWPLGDPSSNDFRYCGSPSSGGTPYCQHHGKIAYQPTQDRRRERDTRRLLAR